LPAGGEGVASSVAGGQDLQGAAEKNNPLRFFAVLSAVAWNFKAKFYEHI